MSSEEITKDKGGFESRPPDFFLKKREMFVEENQLDSKKRH